MNTVSNPINTLRQIADKTLATCLVSALLGPWATTALAQSDNCEVIDFNEFNHGDSITSLSLFGGTFTLDVTAVRNDPAGDVDATAYDTERWDDAGNPPPNNTHDDTQLNIDCNDASNGGLGNCDGIMAVIPDVNFENNGDDTQGGTITFTSTGGEFEITEYKAVDSDNFDRRIILNVNGNVVGVATEFGNASVITVPTDDHSTTQAVFEFLGSGGIDDIEVCIDDPGIDIEKLTNGNQADGANDADVPRIAPGDTVTWTYQVTNTGNVAFAESEVVVTDDQPGVAPELDVSSDDGDLILSPGEIWVYTASAQALDLQHPPMDVTVVPGCGDGRPTYENTGRVDASSFSLFDEDLSHYCNPRDAAGITRTLGYWKNHPNVIDGSFDGPGGFPSLLPLNFCGEAILEPCDAVDFLSTGGGGIRNFKRQGMAALLNCQAFGCPSDILDLIQQGSAACASGAAFNFGDAGDTLDVFNNSGKDLDLPFQSPSAQPMFCR